MHQANLYAGRFALTLQEYHAVPKGWSQAELIGLHHSLGGMFSIDVPVVVEPGAPSYFDDRAQWLQYRATMKCIAEGVRFGDAACVELAVRYLVERPIGSYSGYLRARLARALRHADLNHAQEQRLDAHFRALVLARDYTADFRECAKFWCKFASPISRQIVLKAQEGCLKQSTVIAPSWFNAIFNITS